jgi:hypothetical protein
MRGEFNAPHPAGGASDRIAVAFGDIVVTIYARLDDWRRGRR